MYVFCKWKCRFCLLVFYLRPFNGFLLISIFVNQVGGTKTKSPPASRVGAILHVRNGSRMYNYCIYNRNNIPYRVTSLWIFVVYENYYFDWHASSYLVNYKLMAPQVMSPFYFMDELWLSNWTFLTPESQLFYISYRSLVVHLWLCLCRLRFESCGYVLPVHFKQFDRWEPAILMQSIDVEAIVFIWQCVSLTS